MERPNTVAGLLEMHRDVAGQIEAARQHLARLAADLDAIEHTILLFDPDASLPRARPVAPRDPSMKGETRRHVMAALRAAQGPLTSLGSPEQGWRRGKLNPHATAMTRKRVSGAALWKLRQRGWVAEVPLEGTTRAGG